MGKLNDLLILLKEYYEEFIDALQEYEGGKERIYAVERLAQLIAQCILDFAAIFASKKRGVKPSSYRELARWLARQVGLNEDLTGSLEGLAGFRNILVNMYAEIDRDLEMNAFREMAEKTPIIVDELAKLAKEDPCIDDVREKIIEFVKQLNLRLVLVFGSLARNRCGIDMDLAVKLGYKPRSMIEVGRLQVLIEDKLGVPVDLVILDTDINPTLAKTIVDEAILLYEDPWEAEEELLRLYKLYLDYTVIKRIRSR